MTLVEKIQRLKSMSSALRVNMRDVYLSKGVTIPDGELPSLNDMPTLTEQIEQGGDTTEAMGYMNESLQLLNGEGVTKS